jgi:hypothetical protein
MGRAEGKKIAKWYVDVVGYLSYITLLILVWVYLYPRSSFKYVL